MVNIKDSVKFKNTSKNISDLAMEMCKSEEFKRYIAYLGEKHPLDKSLPNVSRGNIIDKHFNFNIFNDEILSDKQVTIFFFPTRSFFPDRNLSDDYYELDIVVPNKDWLLITDEGFELRGYEIAHHLAKSIDQKRITGIGDVNIVESNTQALGQKYSLIQVIILARNSKVKQGL